MTLWLLATGCAMFHSDDKQTAALRIHVESETAAAGSSQSISVLRAQPVSVNISTQPILTEADLLSAKLIESPNDFSVALNFDESSSWTLEQYTAVNLGKHLVIFGQWSLKPADGRWLSAPLISRRVAGGSLVFTPDATREEARQLVDGLNAFAKKNAGLKAKE